MTLSIIISLLTNNRYYYVFINTTIAVFKSKQIQPWLYLSTFHHEILTNKFAFATITVYSEEFESAKYLNIFKRALQCLISAGTCRYFQIKSLDQNLSLVLSKFIWQNRAFRLEVRCSFVFESGNCEWLR